MTAIVDTRARTIENQHRASDPAHSAWVRANAGSGKTHVLAQRVIRLLLEGVPPAKILCLTFTKAAAANMSIRIFDTLAHWTALDDEGLRAEIRQSGATPPANLDFARQLFVRTVETPGGLKVQTIHAFCERLLHLFPFEANVGANFEAIDAEVQNALLEEACVNVLNGEVRDPDDVLRKALALIAEETTEIGFASLLKTIIHETNALRFAESLQSNGLRSELCRRIGVHPDDNREALSDAILDGSIEPETLAKIIAHLDASSAKDQALAGKLKSALILDDRTARAETYAAAFFTTDGRPTKTLATKNIPPAIRDQLHDEQGRVGGLRDRMRAVSIVDRTCALYAVGNAVRQQYNTFKNSRGYLDFGDLIDRVATLLSRYDAGWILFKLDAGIDHVLIDEAQDTSPLQWRILERLTGDFFAGEAARSEARTFFAVGDEKQSIFSFQGAAPREFGRQRDRYRKAVKDAGRELYDVPLNVSFRSSKVVLNAVDQVFDVAGNRAGLTVNDEAAPVHEAWRASLPGYVELSPLIGPQPSGQPDDWLLPVNALRADDPAEAMARQVAEKISELVSPKLGHAVYRRDETSRPVSPGDIMILVRKRGPFFESVIRALKDRAIPVAGADRLNITDHIAIMDLIAAGQAALLPTDDLTLACVLKSPLIGLDDDDLLAIAPQRESSLIAALENSAEPRHIEAAQTIRRWQGNARMQGPFDFFSAILGAERGRHKLLRRLGQEASDAIDEFLRLALDGSAPGSATLAQFLNRLSATGFEIKRDMEGAGDAVRVMTVHAAKGLEAKIVFLPDTCSSPGGGPAPALAHMHGEDGQSELFIWRKNKIEDPVAVAAPLQNLAQAETEEHRRLLYVAMTRAEERLYVGGFHGARKPAPESWYRMIETAWLGDLENDERDGRQEAFSLGTESMLETSRATPRIGGAETIPPGWLYDPAPGEVEELPPIRPSTALASADQQPDLAVPFMALAESDEGPFDGVAIGTLVHDLLHRLPDVPRDRRQDVANRFFKARAAGMPSALQDKIFADVVAVLDDPGCAALFGPDARAEVSITGTLRRADGGAADITGRVDRLLVDSRNVIVADFKTGAARPPELTPEPYLRQMALYCAALEPLFPGRQMRAVLIWTGWPQSVELPPELLEKALTDAGFSP